MPLMSRACHICSPRTLSLLLRPDALQLHQFFYPGLEIPAFHTSPVLTLQLRRMSTGKPSSSASSPHEQPSPKRRKIVRAFSPRFIQPYRAMASQTSSDSSQLQLTELESKLRTLLLDVAAYIDNAAESDKKATEVEVPEDLKSEKIVLRWTGGWVRDKLLGVGSHDIDLAINKMTGEHFGLKMQEYLKIPGHAEKHDLIEKSKTNDQLSGSDKSKKIAPGLHKIEANPEKSKNLETATTKIMGIDLDLVNLRKETYNEVSRNPEMEFGTAEEDAMRRDATVNAMFYNLHTCQVEDFTGRGFEDMAAKTIRTPLEPYQTFKDDPLRVLRLIRFASRLDYTIEPETAKAMGNPDIQEVLKIKISRERVGIELEKMLKGPQPRMALGLIDRFNLYGTVFTDPTRELPCEPDVSYFKPAYDFVETLVQKSDELGHPNLSEILLRGSEEHYLAWICATLIPWADAPNVPHSKPTQRPYYAAYLVAREGFKAPNKVCDVVTASLNNGEEIRNTVTRCYKGLQLPASIKPLDDATARDTLGMAIRRWGSSWRTQVLFSLMYEVVLGRVSREQILRSYSIFLGQVAKLEVLEADTFKPLINGKDLAKALQTKPGPWMKDALDVVMAWQLRNPTITDPTDAIEAVKATRKGELPSRLASHFLELTIPPFFPQTSRVSSFGAIKKSWQEAGNEYVLELLKWAVSILEKKDLEKNWHLLVPPILQMIDDIEIQWKAKGCQLLEILLRSSASQGNSAYLARTGYDNVFAETLWPLFTYLPSLTPEKESVVLLHEVFPALIALGLELPSERKGRFLDKLIREGVLSPLSHFPTPSTYPELAATIVSQIPVILGHMEIESVKHLTSLLPLLTAILQEPFALSHQPLLLATLKAIQSVILNGWPRMAGHRGTVMLGVSTAWSCCVEEEKRNGKNIMKLKTELQETVAMLDAVLTADDDVAKAWVKEKQDVVDASSAYTTLFEKCGDDG